MTSTALLMLRMTTIRMKLVMTGMADVEFQSHLRSSCFISRSFYNVTCHRLNTILDAINSASSFIRSFIMVALWNMADHYIFILWFLLSKLIYLLLRFSSPNLSGRALDVYHTSSLRHMVWP